MVVAAHKFLKRRNIFFIGYYSTDIVLKHSLLSKSKKVKRVIKGYMKMVCS